MKGFSPSNLKSMRSFYEGWASLESKSPVMAGDLQNADSEEVENRQLQLANFSDFPWAAFLSIGFTHHCTILTKVKDEEERKFYIQLCADLSLSDDALRVKIAEDTFHNQGKMPNNFGMTIPDYKRAFHPQVRYMALLSAGMELHSKALRWIDDCQLQTYRCIMLPGGEGIPCVREPVRKRLTRLSRKWARLYRHITRLIL